MQFSITNSKIDRKWIFYGRYTLKLNSWFTSRIYANRTDAQLGKETTQQESYNDRNSLPHPKRFRLEKHCEIGDPIP